MLMEYFRAFVAELLKVRRTWAFTLSVAAPLSCTLFIFLVSARVQKGQWNDVWIYYLRGVTFSWLLMMMPLYAALLQALLASTDHTSGTWKLLLAQPISRPPLYIAKVAMGTSLGALSTAVLALSSLNMGLLLRKVRPDLGNYSQGVEVAHFVKMLSFAFVAASLIVALHSWLSARTGNFALSLGVAMFAEVANILGFQQKTFPKIWPWLYPLDAARIFGLQHRDTIQNFWSMRQLVLVSVVGAAVVTVLAIWDFNRRETM
ncbi:MAG TPA: ABC transporter permease [Candidatus Methylomirabilis sp.]|nr:ABC transporter permease [Candidatus Methylomirabilis sp.]